MVLYVVSGRKRTTRVVVPRWHCRSVIRAARVLVILSNCSIRSAHLSQVTRRKLITEYRQKGRFSILCHSLPANHPNRDGRGLEQGGIVLSSKYSPQICYCGKALKYRPSAFPSIRQSWLTFVLLRSCWLSVTLLNSAWPRWRVTVVAYRPHWGCVLTPFCLCLSSPRSFASWRSCCSLLESWPECFARRYWDTHTCLRESDFIVLDDCLPKPHIVPHIPWNLFYWQSTVILDTFYYYDFSY